MARMQRQHPPVSSVGVSFLLTLDMMTAAGEDNHLCHPPPPPPPPLLSSLFSLGRDVKSKKVKVKKKHSFIQTQVTYLRK